MKIRKLNEDTTANMQSMFDKIGNKWVTYNDILDALQECGWNTTTSYDTFMKRAIMETKVEDHGEYIPLEQFVEFVNSLAGDDLYDEDFHYEVRDGKVYERKDVRLYYMKGIK